MTPRRIITIALRVLLGAVFVYASVSGLPENYIQELGGLVGEVKEFIEGVRGLTN